MEKRLILICIGVLFLAGCPAPVYCPDYPGERGLRDCRDILPTPEEEFGDETPEPTDMQVEMEVLESLNKTLPVVAIHVSELGRKGWSRLSVPYFEQYTALEEILNAHKIPFVEVSDEDIEQGGLLLDDGRPKFPILFTLNNEVWRDQALDAVTEYTNNGGVVYFSYSTFTRKPDVPREQVKKCFLIEEIQLECILTDLKENIINTDTLQKKDSHPITEHIPSGDLVWRMSRYLTTRYDLFWVKSTGATEHLTGKKDNNEGLLLSVQNLGNGAFIYNSQINMFWGRYQGEPGIYNAMIGLNAIQWAFDRAEVPLIYLRPWGQFDSAFTLRFDVETTEDDFFELFPKFVDVVARFNETGTFYILVDQEARGKPDPRETYFSIRNPAVADALKDARDKGMIIGSHSTWHIGPDFDGVVATTNIQNSLEQLNIAMGERTHHWVAPAFTANTDRSLRIIEDLGIKVTGNQGIGYLPHFALSPIAEGRHLNILELPTVDFYHPAALDGKLLATVMDHHKRQSIADLIDFYNEREGLINLYAHIKEENLRNLEFLLARVDSKPNVWHADPDQLLEYWTRRDMLSYESISRSDGEVMIRLNNAFDAPNSGVMRVNLPDGMKVEKVVTVSPIITGYSSTPAHADIAFVMPANSTEEIVLRLGEV